jgi:hypothetical protein
MGVAICSSSSRIHFTKFGDDLLENLIPDKIGANQTLLSLDEDFANSIGNKQNP